MRTSDMAIESESVVFKSTILEGGRVPWMGLGASVLIHLVLVPVLSSGLEQSVRWPLRTEADIEPPLVIQRVYMLKLSADIKNSPELPKKTRETRAKGVDKGKPAATKALNAIAPAPPLPIPSQTESRPQNETIVILQPSIVQPELPSVPDIALPTITMVAPVQPKERKVFDVGSIQKVRSMPKISDPGPLPEPPELMAAANVIRPQQVAVLVPKLPVYTAPLPLETIKAPDLQAVSAGGAVVEAPANLVLGSSKPIPAKETILLPAAIVIPKGGAGTDAAGGLPQPPASVTGVAGGSIGGTGQAKRSVGAVVLEKSKDPAAGSVKPDAGGATGSVKTAGNTVPDVTAPIRIVHPLNGRHNVTIVQSGVEQILPKARGLLKGDPVYTVYLKVGWSKEWVMHYCLPREGPPPPKQVGGVVSLSSPKEVLPPYPMITLAPLQPVVPFTQLVPGIAAAKRAPLLFYGFLDTKGELEGMKQEGADESGMGALILRALESWKMRPATRGDEAVRVQVILVVPMA